MIHNNQPFTDVQQYLEMEYGTFVNIRNADFSLAVLRATKENDTVRLKNLFSKYHEPIVGTSQGADLLVKAVNENDVLLLKGLLGIGIPVDAVSAKGYTALHTACFLGYEMMTSVLLQAGADPRNTEPKYKQNALHIACTRQMTDCVKVIMENTKGNLLTFVNGADKDGFTPLSLVKNHILRALLVSYGAAT